MAEKWCIRRLRWPNGWSREGTIAFKALRYWFSLIPKISTSDFRRLRLKSTLWDKCTWNLSINPFCWGRNRLGNIKRCTQDQDISGEIGPFNSKFISFRILELHVTLENRYFTSHISKSFWWSESAESCRVYWFRLGQLWWSLIHLLLDGNQIVSVPRFEDSWHFPLLKSITDLNTMAISQRFRYQCKWRQWPWNDYFLKRHYQQWCEQDAQTALPCTYPWPGNGHASVMGSMSLAQILF